MFTRFTTPARNVVTGAQAQARALGDCRVGTEHLLLALLNPDSGRPAAILGDAGVSRDHVVAEIGRLSGRRPALLGPADIEALRAIGIDVDAVVAAVEGLFGPGALRPSPTAAPVTFGRRLRRRVRRMRPRHVLSRRRRRRRACGDHLLFTPRSKKVLELSLRESLRLKHDHIDPEHILLGLLREGEGLAAQILVGTGLTLDDLRQRTLRALDAAA